MLRVFLSPLLVILIVLIVPSIEKALFFLPLIFALSISLVNFSKFKINNKYLGIFLTIFQSYVVFLGLVIATFFFDELLQNISIMDHDDAGFKGIILVTLGGYLAALLLFYFFSF